MALLNVYFCDAVAAEEAAREFDMLDISSRMALDRGPFPAHPVLLQLRIAERLSTGADPAPGTVARIEQIVDRYSGRIVHAVPETVIDPTRIDGRPIPAHLEPPTPAQERAWVFATCQGELDLAPDPDAHHSPT